MAKEESSQRKLVRLLKDLFQFDVSELDFGIYRIMNHKRDAIERFIEKDLIERAELVFKEYARESASTLKMALDELKSEINETIEAGTIDEHGKVTKHEDIKKVKEYLKKQEEYQNAQIAQGKVDDVYNHIYEFFSRYYDQGDFFSKRRRGGRDKYAIPYNGEEVLLHWANRDQYYIKSGEYFTNYEFRAGAWVVKFILVHAEIDPNNVKGEKRFFILAEQKPELDTNAKDFRVFFNYRGLTEDELKQTKALNKQAEMAARAEKDILSFATVPELKQSLTKKVKVGDNEKSLLEKNLSTYVAKNTTDYFIHKNLKGFFDGELEFYIKNEVLLLDEIARMSETALRQMMAQVKAIREISHTIIDFLAQIEDFQKMLWEKKKFVIETQYCITVGNIDEVFYPQIAANDDQWVEWKELFNIDEDKQDLFTMGKGKQERRRMFLKAHPTLVLDTRHFNADFADRLLATFKDLDGMTDGLLVHSENFQALQLLFEKYREKIKCIYIDPPYNTGADDFLYKDNYQQSSWLTMLDDRLRMSTGLLTADGVTLVSIDDTECHRLRTLFDQAIGYGGFVGAFVWRRRVTSSMAQSWVSTDHEYVIAYSPNVEMLAVFGSERDLSKYNIPDGKGRLFASMPLTVGMNRQQRPNQWYELVNPKTGKGYWPPPNRIWGFYPPTMQRMIEADRIIWPEDYPDRNMTQPRIKVYAEDAKRKRKPLSTWLGGKGDKTADDEKSEVQVAQVGRNEEGTRWLKTLFGEFGPIYPKPLSLISSLLQQFSFNGDVIFDFFAGSGTTGHAAVDLNRSDGSRRQFVLIEFADYFHTFLLPRIKKITYTPEWKDGKPAREATVEEIQRGPRIIKYIDLEQYEDTLNNIVFQARDRTAQEKLDMLTDYFVRYMLDYETHDSPARFAVKEFEDPFNYKLWIERDGVRKAQNVDLVETFNYLLGLEVNRIITAKDGDRYYRTVQSKKRDGKIVLVVWRSIKDIDLECDRDFIERTFLKDGKPDILYVNGQCYVKDAIPIEPDFKKLMGA